MFARNQAIVLYEMIADDRERTPRFEQFIGPIVLINSGHGVPGAKPSNAFHHWENDLRICFEQFDKHFVGAAGEHAFPDFKDSILSFLTGTLKLKRSDNGVQCLEKLALEWRENLINSTGSTFSAPARKTIEVAERNKGPNNLGKLLTKQTSENSLGHPQPKPTEPAQNLQATGNNQNIMLVGYINQFVLNTTPSQSAYHRSHEPGYRVVD